MHDNEDYLAKIAGSDQKLQVEFAFGSSVKEVLDDQSVPLIDHLKKGFNIKAEVTLIDNMKKVIADMLKNENINKKHRNRLSFLLLSFILKINGKIEIDFDDFVDVRDHPVVEPFMHSF